MPEYYTTYITTDCFNTACEHYSTSYSGNCRNCVCYSGLNQQQDSISRCKHAYYQGYQNQKNTTSESGTEKNS